MSGTTLKELLELPADDRFTLIEALWDSLAQAPESVPIPQWHLDELDRRLRELDSGEVETHLWPSLRDTLWAELVPRAVPQGDS
jgi:putative addiction module component (TIGR02574 family)